MLFNLVIALWALGRGKATGAVGERALDLPEDATAAEHRSYKALHEAIYADADRAAAPLEVDDDRYLERDVQGARALARAVVEGRRLANAPWRELIAGVRPHLDDAHRTGWTSDSVYERALWAIASQRPLWTRPWWWLVALRWQGLLRLRRGPR